MNDCFYRSYLSSHNSKERMKGREKRHQARFQADIYFPAQAPLEEQAPIIGVREL